MFTFQSDTNNANSIWTGSILAKHLRSTYGFIKPDGRSSFYDNIFFNQQACEGLDEDTDLRQHFKDGDRCVCAVGKGELGISHVVMALVFQFF